MKLHKYKRNADDPRSHTVKALAQYGFSYQLISDKTGWEKNKIAGYLHDIELKVKDYRNGESDIAKGVLRSLSSGDAPITQTNRLKKQRRRAG